jgi:hypothetical protein
MKQRIINAMVAAGICLVPVTGHSQQLGGTTADSKMRGSGGGGSAMGSLYSPNLYDGSANVNIPIYQYSAEGGEYGVSMGYNTRGVKLDELAGPIGLHWSLNAGGSIQRVVKDIPDDVYVENYNDIEVDNNTVLVNPEKKLRGRLLVYGETVAEAAEDSIYRDAESDDYIVSLGGLSFTFNLGKNGYVFTIPERRVKVELLRNSAPVTSLSSAAPIGTLEFRITDEQGNRYLFSGGDYVSEEVQDKYGYQQNIGWYTYSKSWVIKKVTTSSGAEINYYYSNTGATTSPYKQYSAVEPGPPYNGPGGSPFNDLTIYKRLDSIAYPNGITTWFKFDEGSPTTNSDALREIRLQSNGQAQLRYKMNQSYFVASNLPGTDPNHGLPEVPYNTTYGGDKLAYRLKLNSISIAGQSGPEETFYSFTYDPLLLPKRFNGSQDYYGYYNGKIPTPYSGSSADPELSIPDHQPFMPAGSSNTPPFYGVNKSPDINYLKACVLTHIRNAYGGQVQFLYDEHVLNAVLTTANTLGLPTTDGYFMGQYAYDGLRLQAIIEKDTFHVENFKKTTFTYSNGQLFLNGGYYNYPYRLFDSNHTTKQMLMGNQYVSRHQFVAGSNHGYSTVTVKQVDNNNNQLARTEYNFTNFKDENNNPRYQRCGTGSLYFFEFPFAEKQFLRDWEMGLPLSVKEYDQNDRITLETTNAYSFSTDITSSLGQIENSRIAQVRTDYVPATISIPHSVNFIDNYRPFRGKAQLMTTTVKKYVTDISYVNDAVTYSYDNRNNLTYTLAKNSKGEYFKTENIYNYDLDVLPGSGLQAFTDAGLQKLVSTQRWKTDAAGTAYTRLMDGFIGTFDYAGQQVKPKGMYNFIAGDAVTRNQYMGYSGVGPVPNAHGKVLQAFTGVTPLYFRKASEVMLSDAKGNPLESRIGDQDQYKAMIWDNANGKKLAEAGNCHYADIAYCGFESGPAGTSLLINAGNLSYDQLHVVAVPAQGSVYGAAFRLTNVIGGNKVEGTQNLDAGKEYILSFWAQGGQPLVYSGSTQLTLPAASATYYNWSYYTLRFTPSVAGKIKIATPGTGTIYIDEVRLYPFTAQMQNWNYTPMFGAATTTDVNGRITFIQYDDQGRQKIIRDKDGNIISKTEYGIQ